MAPSKTTASKPAAKTKGTAKRPAKKPATPKTPKPDPAASPATPISAEDELLATMDPRHVSFVEGYLATYNQTAAYRSAFDATGGMSDNTCAANASRLLRTDKVARLMALRIRKTFDDVDGDIKTRALERLMGIAFADPNELSELRWECCRYCHGVDHQYQYKPSEWREKLDTYKRDLAEAVKSGGKMPDEPDELGGTGYDPRLPPSDSCPECFGEGTEREVFKDTRFLSPAGNALYAGVKRTKDGLEIKTHDQLKAFDMLAKVIKMLDDRPEAVIGVVPTQVLDDLYNRAWQNMEAGRASIGKRLGNGPPARPELPQ